MVEKSSVLVDQRVKEEMGGRGAFKGGRNLSHILLFTTGKWKKRETLSGGRPSA